METSLPELIRFGREICGDLAQAERREWWLSNGLGGYAAGTIAGTLTRRYHGLLVAPVNPPLGRHLVVAKADATLSDGTREWPLFTNRWGGGAVAPAGYLDIESFKLDGRIPVWRFACGELRVESRVWMEHGENTTYVGWKLLSGGPVPARPLVLKVRLLVNARDFHGLSRPWDFNPMIEAGGAHMRVAHANWFTLHLKSRGGAIASRHDWYENFDLPVERERGLGDRDCHLCVGEAQLEMHPDEWVGVVASLNANASVYLEEALRRAQARDLGQLRRAQVQVPELLNAPRWLDQLVLAADDFVFSRPLPEVPDGESVIAGYPWFGDWGRDTMIALPGLTLATGRFDTARRILQTFARFVDQGMLPNVFPGAGDKPEYNTVDAALWYIEAWRAYVDALEDVESLKRAFPVLESIVEWHLKGTRYGIGVDAADGLLRAGEAGRAAHLDGRQGRRLGGDAAHRQAGGDQRAVVQRAHRHGRLRAAPQAARRSAISIWRRGRASGFASVCPSPTAGALRRHRLDRRGDDATVRPEPDLRRQPAVQPARPRVPAGVVRTGGRELLTSYGLRSLSPQHQRLSAALPGRRLGARRRLPPGAGVGVPARALRARRASRVRRRGNGAGAARPAARPPARCGAWAP